VTSPPPPRRVPLPSVLLLLTVVSGVVDAISYLRFGHVFVSNMTGNTVFLGFAAAGAPGLSVAGSLTALACFLAGSFAVGRLAAVLRGYGPRVLAVCVACEALVAALVLGAVAFAGLNESTIAAAIVLFSVAMGAQNAAARTVAIPDLTTTVITLTLTGIASDLVADLAGGRVGARLARRIAAVVAMLAGAFGGAMLVLHAGIVPALALLVALLIAAAALALPHAAAEPPPRAT